MSYVSQLLRASSQFQASDHKSAGRVQILGGDLYYSPNSSRDVELPRPHRHGSNPFSPPVMPNGKDNLWQIDTSEYEQPQWWGDHYGWIAFYNKTVLDTSSTLFRNFRKSPAQFVYEEGVGYRLPHWQAEEWLRLDKQISHAIYTLGGHYHILGLFPKNPWAFGYLRPHSKPGILSFCLEKTKKWFIVWLALLSFRIAASESRELRSVKDYSLARQNWKDLLVNKSVDIQIDHAWIDLLLDSSVAMFSPNVPRTGAFVYLTSEDNVNRENGFQPEVEWFIEYGVPVWYRWDKEAASLPNAKHLAPLESQLQQVDSFMRKSPTPSPPVAASIDPQKHFSTVQMDAFFKLRDERTARLKMQETPQQRALRLSREKQPPTVKTRVFEWTANAEGEYIYEELTTNALRRQALDYYNGNQLRYNAVLNEWHVCELWDDFEDSEDKDDYFPTFEGDDTLPKAFSPTQVQSYNDNALFDDALPLVETESYPQQPGQENRRALQLQGEILHIAMLYFGYTPRIPLPKVKPLEIEQQRKKFCRSFGLIWNQVEPIQDAFAFPAVAAAVDFFQRLAKNIDILPDECDLYNANRQSVVRSPRFKLFRPMSSISAKNNDSGKHSSTELILYVLELGSKATAPWKLAVKNASDALMICRLDLNFNEFDIVDFLLTNGIAFHTLQPPSTVLPNVPRPSLTPLTRVEGYQFGSRDYFAYREHCHAILNHPRGRAALMHGHFMWRIAFHSVMWEAVYSGPSGCSTDPDEMVVVQDASGNKYIDDKLSSAEQEALCGTYHCFTGNGKQFAIKSWYMPPRMFENSTLALGRWSTHTESLFALLDRTFTDQSPVITRGPLSRSQWDDRGRSSQDIKKARQRLEGLASKLFI